MKNKPKLIYGVDEKLWRNFRVYCLKENRYMHEVLNEILADFLKQKKEVEKNEKGLER